MWLSAQIRWIGPSLQYLKYAIRDRASQPAALSAFAISGVKEKRNLIIRRRDTGRVHISWIGKNDRSGDCPSPPSFHARRSTARVFESRGIRDYHLRYQFSVISLQITCRATSRVIQLSQWESCFDPRRRDARATSSMRDCDSCATRSSPRANRKSWTNGRKLPWKSRIKFTI